MLTRKDLCRRHNTGLIAVVDGLHRRQYRHQRLAAADIAFEQAVHLPAARDIGPYLLEHPLLGSCQGEFQIIVSVVECIAEPFEHQPVRSPHTDVLLFEQGQLQIEQFLELQTVLGSGQ